MYIITVLFGILAVISGTAANFEKELKEVIVPKCVTESKVDAATVAKVFGTDDVIDPTPENKCFMKCLYVNFGMMDEAGKITPENLNAELKDESKGEKYRECTTKADINKPDPCDTAYELHKCLST